MVVWIGIECLSSDSSWSWLGLILGLARATGLAVLMLVTRVMAQRVLRQELFMHFYS